jgi:opacity protein-like surface antigen
MYIKHFKHLVLTAATLLPFTSAFAVITSPKPTQSTNIPAQNATTAAQTSPVQPAQSSNNDTDYDDYDDAPRPQANNFASKNNPPIDKNINYTQAPGSYSGANIGGIVQAQGGITRGITYEPYMGYQFNKYLAIQLAGMIGNHDNYWLMGEALFKLPIGEYITPYFLAGSGYTHLPGSSGGFEVGAGISFNVTNRIAITPLYKYIQTFSAGTPSVQVVSLGLTFFVD